MDGVTAPRELADVPAIVAVPVLLSIGTAAGVLGCSPRTLRRRIASGELPAVADHGRVMIRGDELRAYVDRLERVAAPRAGRAHTPQARSSYDFLRAGG